MKQSIDRKQKYYLCDYRYEGEKWCIEIPAESWEDAKARLKRIAHADVVGEVKATVPVQPRVWTQLIETLRKIESVLGIDFGVKFDD